MSEYQNFDDYNDNNDDNEYNALSGKKITVGKIIKKTLLYSLRISAFLVIAILLWRIFSGEPPKNMKELIFTEATAQSITENPDSFIAYHYIHEDNLTPDGKFAVSHVYYIPSEKQVQVTVRYNNSTIKKLVQEYSLSEEPAFEPFIFTLTDGLGNTYTEYKYISGKRNMYNYRKLVFDGVDFSSLIIEEPAFNATDEEVEAFEEIAKDKYIVLNVYYKNDVLLSKPYGSLSVFDYSYYREPLDMSKYTKKSQTVTPGLSEHTEYTVKEEPAETTEN
ncbi:MAG: hypothetical protein IKU48_04015 [Clostridia bacterium]|nr:hypothetical protein [Clostridia bacterium]